MEITITTIILLVIFIILVISAIIFTGGVLIYKIWLAQQDCIPAPDYTSL